jgi:hypothetical protein
VAGAMVGSSGLPWPSNPRSMSAMNLANPLSRRVESA